MTDLVLTRENYYDVGTEKELVISNSSLSYINPDQGGSLIRFKKYLTDKTEKQDSAYLEKGKMLHRYAEDKDSFAVEEADKPSDNICAIVKYVYEEAKKNNRPFGTLSDHETVCAEAAAVVDYGQTWKAATVVAKIKAEGEEYYQFLVNNSGKFMLSRDVKHSLTNMVESLSRKDTSKFLVDKKPSEYPTPFQAETLGEKEFFAKEYPILFKVNDLTCKALIDNLYVNFDRKEIIIRDIKTTSKPVNLFMGRSFFNISASGNIFPQIDPGSFQRYHYYRQMAFYLDAVKSLFQNLQGYKFAITMTVVESADPFETMDFAVAEQWIQAGRVEYMKCLSLVRQYMEQEGINAEPKVPEKKI